MVEAVKKFSKPVSGDMIAQVGTISANGDETIGNTIAEAMKKVGKDGVITVEESRTMSTELQTVEGMQFDRGYLSPYFISDPDRMECVLEDPYILIHEKKITQHEGPAARTGADRTRGQAAAGDRRGSGRRGSGDAGGQQAARHAERLRGEGSGLRRSPQSDARRHRHPDRRHRPIFEETGIKLEGVQLKDLGRAKRITVDKDNTTIIDGAGAQKAIEGRIKQLRAQIDETTSDYDREKLQERLAKLAGGVAVIKVGAATETEMKEKKARVEDALHATRAAVEEGIVPGGGVALLRAASALDGLKAEADEQIGVNIIRRACEEPVRQIVGNAGL